MALEVAVDDAVPFVLGDVGQRAKRYPPRKERERVDRAELVDGARNERAPTGEGGHVGGVEHGVQLVGQRRALVDIDVVDDDGGALGGEETGDMGAEIARSTGDDRHPTFEQSHGSRS